jgi:hypothetical protein
MSISLHFEDHQRRASEAGRSASTVRRGRVTCLIPYEEE